MSASASAVRTVTCPGCQTSYRLPEHSARPTAPCKRCGKVISLTPANLPTPSLPPTGGNGGAAEAIHHRSTRARRALGGTPRQPVSPLHVAAGILTLAVLAACIFFFA